MRHGLCMLQHTFAAAILVAALALALTSGCASAVTCERLALPGPALSEARLRECVAAVLEDEIQRGTTYSLAVRAGARDVIVNRRMVEVRESLVQITQMDRHDNPIDLFSTTSALYALTLLRDRDAVAMNLRYLDASSPPALLSSAVDNLAFVRYFGVSARVAKIAEQMIIDEHYAQAMISVLNYLAAAGHESGALCDRLRLVEQFLERCAPACDPGTADLLRGAAEKYSTTAHCSSPGRSATAVPDASEN